VSSKLNARGVRSKTLQYTAPTSNFYSLSCAGDVLFLFPFFERRLLTLFGNLIKKIINVLKEFWRNSRFFDEPVFILSFYMFQYLDVPLEA
jgi:hypothetical protein